MTGPDRYAVAADVAWVDAEHVGEARAEVYVARLPDGEPLLLRDGAWAIWHGVAQGGTVDDIVGHAADLSGAERDVIADDVARFVESLVARGLVVPTPSA